MNNVTLGISCKGNIRALTMCLAGALNSAVVPGRIQIRLEGEFPGFSDFYFEQLADLALLRGTFIEFVIAKSTGVRDSRDWQLDNCETKFLWMLDDDVVPDSRCLLMYEGVVNSLVEVKAFIAGSKCDVNNRRNYPHFSMDVAGPEAVVEGANHSLIYDINACFGMSAPTKVLDTGNCLFNVPVIKEHGCRFRLFDDSANPSGDATTFSLVLNSHGLKGIFCPSAAAYHLEKPDGGFNEFAARREMLLRTADVKGFDKGIINRYFMPPC